jgi:hypothetical protein
MGRRRDQLLGGSKICEDAHDIVVVCEIVDPGNPDWVRRAGIGEDR